MANNCWAYVQFQGNKVQEALDYVLKLSSENEGFGFQIKKDSNDRCLFDVEINGETMSFWSKWSPVPLQIKALADMFELGFTYEYDEPGNEMFGEFSYAQGNDIDDVCLNEDDFKLFEYDSEKDCYMFRGEEWESDSEIKEILLNEAKNR